VNKDRFKSQALLDEQALLACLVYVDLNPIRAGICNTLEDSEYTSIAQRLEEYSNGSKQMSPIDDKQHISLKSYNSANVTIPLARFIGGSQSAHGIPYAEENYFELADWTGRAIRDDKKGYIPQTEPKILNKLGISSETWLETVDNFTHHFHSYVGPEEKMESICQQQKKKWLLGIKTCRRLFTGQNQISS